MADRNIIEFDPATNELKKRSYARILQMLATELGNILGDDIDLGGESNLGNELRFKAKLFSEFAEFAVDMLQSSNSATAKGYLLDLLLMNSSGLTRNVDRAAVANITFSVPDTTPVLDPIDGITLVDLDGVMWIGRVEGFDMGSIVNDRQEYNADFVCNLFGDYSVTSNSEFVRLNVGGQLITDDIEIVVGTLPHLVSAGTVKETDVQYRARVNDALSMGAKTLASSMKNELLKTMGQYVRDVLVINSVGISPRVLPVLNDAGAVTNVSVPIHDIFVVVQSHDGVNITTQNTSHQIATILQEQITPGIRTYVKNNGVPLESPFAVEPSYIEKELDAGVDGGSVYKEYLRFKVASVYNPAIVINLKSIGFDPNDTTVTDYLDNIIIEKIINLSKGYLINQDIDTLTIREIIKDEVVPNRYKLDESTGDGAVYIAAGEEVNYGHWKVTANQITISWV